MLVAIGAVISGSGISFWPILVAGAIGAALGDWLSYWVGLKLGPAVAHMWPLSRHPELIPRGERFVKLWGALGIMIGRFFGPLRASGAAGGRDLRHAVLAVPGGELRLGLHMGGDMLLTLGDGISKIFKFIWP